jgi:hypothetical protein
MRVSSSCGNTFLNPAYDLKVPRARVFSALQCFMVSASNDLSVADGPFDQVFLTIAIT